METRASYLLVGVFALLSMAGFLIAVVWMAGVNLDEDFAYYDIYFEGSVSGLKPGNAVRYRGIPVGVVSDMTINPKNVEQVRVTIEIPESTPVKEDTEAALEFQGITGVAYVQLLGGTHAAANLSAATDDARPVIKSRPSQLQELFDSAPELVTRVTALVNRANMLFDPENRKNIAATLSNVGKISGVLAARSSDIDGLLGDATMTMKELRGAAKETGETIKDVQKLAASMQALSDSLNKDLSGVGDEAKKSLIEVRKTAQEFRRASFVLADLVESNREPVDTFASSGLYELTQLLSETRVLVGALTRISSQIERDPARFLFGKTQPGVEVK